MDAAETLLRRRALTTAAVGAVLLLGLLPLVSGTLTLLALAGLAVWTAITWFQRFDLLLHLMVLSVFVESVGVGPARVGRVLAATAVAALAARVLFTDWRPRLPRSPGAVLPVALFAVWAFASGLWASDTRAWAFAMGQLALALAYFVTVVLVVERREQVFALLQTMVLGAVFASFIAFAQVAGGAERAVGLQGDPNIYALYQVAALPAAALLATAAPRGRRWTGWVALPLLVLSVLATSSRGGLATAVAVLVVMFARGDLGERVRRHRVAAGSAAAVAAVSALAAAMTFNDRFSPQRVLNDRASGRIDIWYVAFREWQEHALAGIGGGGFKPRSIELLLTEPGVQLVKSHLLLSDGIEVHNIYLETLVEYGAVGFLLFAAVLLTTAWHLQLAGRTTGDPALRALPMVLLAFLAASFFLSVVNNKLLWILVGLAVLLAGRDPLPDRPADDLPTARRARPLGQAPPSLLWTVLVLALVPSLLATTASAYTPDRWASSVQFVVVTDEPPREREASVRTLAALARSRVVAAEAATATGSGLTADQLVDATTVVRAPGSLTFTVTVVDDAQVRSRVLADGVSRTFASRVAALQQGPQTTSLRRATLRVWAGGAVTTRSVPAPALRNGLLSLGLGALVAALVLGTWRRPPAALGGPRRRRPRPVLVPHTLPRR